MLGLFRDNIDNYSALLDAVTVRRLKGDGKAIIAGSIPEAIWDECCASIGELNISFDQMMIYCHKVSGYIPVCNATLEDFAVDGISSLAAEVEYNLMVAIAYALDKAIVYGDGIRMPLGFVSSLPMTANPINATQSWPSMASKNVAKVSGTGVELFKNFIKATAAGKKHTARDGVTYLMSEDTWKSIIVPESLAINAAGAMVAASGNTFPALGGNVIFLDFIPSGDIVGGYLKNYILAERAGLQVNMSEHVLFLQDNTVFKATARYDGSPIVPFRDSFFAINVKNVNPATTISFPPAPTSTVNP